MWHYGVWFVQKDRHAVGYANETNETVHVGEAHDRDDMHKCEMRSVIQRKKEDPNKNTASRKRRGKSL